MSMGPYVIDSSVHGWGRGLQGLSRCELIGEALPNHFLEFRDGALVFRDQYVVEPLTFQDCS